MLKLYSSGLNQLLVHLHGREKVVRVQSAGRTESKIHTGFPQKQMNIYKDFSVVLSCYNYKYHWGMAEFTRMSRYAQHLWCLQGITDTNFSYSYFKVCPISASCAKSLQVWKTFRKAQLGRKTPLEKCMPSHIPMESKVARITKPKDFIQLTFPETPEAIPATEL